MFNTIILNVDPKMTQSIPSPIVINSFHSPAAFTFQNNKITVFYGTSNAAKDKNFVCVVVSISTSHLILSEIDSQVIGGRKTSALFLVHTHWYIAGFVPETNLSYDLVLSTAEC